MSAGGLARKRRLLERPLPWWAFGVAALSSATLAALVVAGGALREYELFPAVLRGYTPLGVLFGVVSALASLVTLFYSARKRALQESLGVARGTLAMWLWAHVVFGVLALGFALLHAGYGAISLQPTSGKALLLLLVLIAASGLLWRLVYAVVPASAARDVGNYSADASEARADAHLVEIEKLAAGRGPGVRELTDWVLREPVDPASAGASAVRLAPPDQAVFGEIVRLAAERHAAISRARRQRRYVERLQGLRVWHVPASLAFVLLLPIHALLAFDVPERVLAKTPAGAAAIGFEAASTCARCHASITREWRDSMHAHALTGPVMIAQTNLAARTTLAELSAPDPRNLCVNCHGPLAARITPSATLPLATPPLGDPDLAAEGITCVVCHAFRGAPETGGAALTGFQHGLRAGRTYYGPTDEPVGNAFHRSEPSPLFADSSELCRSCHSVVYDRNGDGKIEKGADLVLQDLFSEWQAYRAGGGARCVDCHMPLVPGSRAADSASIPFEQDEIAPSRARRSHRFVGPDFPLDDLARRDAGRAEREALLRSAAALALERAALGADGASVEARVRVTNQGTGHNLPGGFAFVRQMWLELSVLDATGRVLAASGALASVSDDLCHESVLGEDAAMRPFVTRCAAADPQLVLFQQQLFDRVEPVRNARGETLLKAADGAREVVVQHVTGGPVARVRGFDRQPLPTLAPGEARRFAYRLAVPEGARPATVAARLLFRAIPPYFLRALAAAQLPSDGQRVDAFVPNLEILEMTRETATIARGSP